MTESTSQSRVLCVDDEPNVLDGLQRILFESYDVSVATGGPEGLELLRTEGPFSVVISDMRMPGMDGAEFLSRVRQSQPDTVRILLTGHADLEATVAAVNEGNIFRFLSKPCPPEVLNRVLEDAVAQYRLVTAERELVEKTLHGAIKVLVDVLGLASPAAFNRAGHVKSYVAHMANRLAVSDAWEFEVAAMLSQLGCVSIPVETLEQIYAGQRVSEKELRIYESHPEVGGRLTAQIPRMERVSEMIRCQRDATQVTDPRTRLGASMIHLARDLDRLVIAGASVEKGLAALQRRGKLDPELVAALMDYQVEQQKEVIKAIPLRDLRSLMILDEDVKSSVGNVIVGKGWHVTPALVERLRNFERGVGIVQPIRVRIPVTDIEGDAPGRAA